MQGSEATAKITTILNQISEDMHTCNHTMDKEVLTIILTNFRLMSMYLYIKIYNMFTCKYSENSWTLVKIKLLNKITKNRLLISML